MSSTNKRLSAPTFIVATLACGLASAQAPAVEAPAAPVASSNAEPVNAAPDSAAAEKPAADSAPQAPAPMQEVVITGSHIARKNFVAESAVASVGADALMQKGPSTVETALNQMPQFAASSGGATQSGANQQARGARANLNLRGLGIARTLVLVDGRRVQPSDPFGNAVDMNTIPSAIISNIDIISGGASAVYGSDAVAGVVNIITKKRFEGVQIDAQYGQTSRADGKSADVNLLLGSKFAEGRGSSLLSLSYFDRQPAYKDSRPFFNGTGDTNAPPQGRYTPSAGNLPGQAALNTLFGGYGSAAPTPTQALSINRDNTLFSTAPARNLRLTAADGFVMQPGNTGFVVATTPHDAGTVLNQTRRYNGYGSWDYALPNGIKAYAVLNYTTYTAGNEQRGTLNGTSPVATVPVTNPNLPADLRKVLASRPNPNAPFNFSFFGDRVGPQVFGYEYQVGQLTAGLKGELPLKDWTWNGYVSSGHTSYDQTASGYVNIGALQSLLNAPDGGASICQGGYNPFSFDAVSGPCAAYLSRTLKEKTTLDQHVFDLTAQGGVMDLPAGEVRAAVGIGYRSLGFEFLGDDQQTFSQVYFSRPVSNSSGTSRVAEIFGEATVPLLHDLPLVKQLELGLAYRKSHYNSIGSVNAYKASTDWLVIQPVRVRAGYQRAVRAPSVGELYGGGRSISSAIGTTASGQGDPCDVTSAYRTGANGAAMAALCAAQGVPAGYRFTGSTVSTSQQGNRDLKAEQADTYTAGVVLQSPFAHALLSGLTVSLDYYKIVNRGAIGFLTTSVNLQRCYNGDGSNPSYSPTNYNCGLLRRDAAGNLSFPTEPAFNLSAYRTTGVDLELDWKANLAAFGLDRKFGRIGINSVISRMNSYEIQNLSTDRFVNYAGTTGNTQVDTFTASHPKLKAQTTFSYKVGPMDLSLGWQYLGKMSSSTNVLTPSANVAGVGAVSYFDLLMRWRVAANTELRAGVQNLSDRQPPAGPVAGQTDVVAYDVLGRRFSLGLNMRF
ncbi:MAG: TonB-dependent receptor [Pseudomonadota bacterium]